MRIYLTYRRDHHECKASEYKQEKGRQEFWPALAAGTFGDLPVSWTDESGFGALPCRGYYSCPGGRACDCSAGERKADIIRTRGDERLYARRGALFSICRRDQEAYDRGWDNVYWFISLLWAM